MVNIVVDYSDIPANGDINTTLYREDLVGVYDQLLAVINNLLNGLQNFDGVLIGTGSLDAKAIMQINSTTKVFLGPRMTTTERDAIASPPNGAWIYNTTINCPQSYNGSSWTSYVPVIADEASCRVFHSTTQAVLNNTLTILDWNSEAYDTDNMHDTVTNNSRITFNTAGKYNIASCVKFATSISNGARIEILLNGTTIIAGQSTGATGAEAPILNIATNYSFISGDYIQVRVFQSSGVSENIDNVTSHFAATRQLD
jgi:hypothetical protein